MKCNQLICAQSVVTDKTTNQVSIFNIYETLFSNLFPLQIPGLAIFIQFEREEGDGLNIAFILKINLDETILYSQPITISFIEPDLKNNTTVNMQGIPISKPGLLTFTIEYNNSNLKSYFFNIMNK